MFTVQRTLFDSKARFGAPDFLGAGCYGSVWAHPDGETVIKRGHSDDGTMAYIYWCYTLQQAGQGMRGMPEVFSFALLEERGWIATMRRYRVGFDGNSEADGPDFEAYGIYSGETSCTKKYMARLLRAWSHAATTAYVYNDYTGMDIRLTDNAGIGDLHSGNFMMDEDGTLILIDPSGCAVDRRALPALRPTAPPFSLTMQ